MLSDSKHHLLMRQSSTEGQFVRSDKLLADALRGFLTELTMTDGEVMMSCVMARKHANLADLIHSSFERMIKPGHLRYANSAAVDFDWGKTPSLAIAMELSHPSLTTYFRVVFEHAHIGVDVLGILFQEPVGDEEENLRRLQEAVNEVVLS
jgi:hypothetical protein